MGALNGLTSVLWRGQPRRWSDRNVTCNRCGTDGLRWAMFDNRWALADARYNKHDCNVASPDEFAAIDE